MRTLVLLTLLVGVGAWAGIRQLPEGEAQAQAQDAPGATDRQEVQSIALDGGRGLPSAALRAVISTKIGDRVDEHRLEADRAALKAALEARGYLAAKVAPATVTHGASGGAYIVFDIERGPMFHLRSVTVTGPGQRDAAVVRLAAGDDAVGERLALARQALADSFAYHGGKQVELQMSTDAAAAAVDVELETR